MSEVIVRAKQSYNVSDMKKIKLRSIITLSQLELLNDEPKFQIYSNQTKIGFEVAEKFSDRKIVNVMVLAQTQSGKTGAMCATIKILLENETDPIDPDNIYIITGVSSCEWKKQTMERIPKSLENRVFHRNELPATFVDEIRSKINVLIIMDEIQVASKVGQTIYKAFDSANFLDLHYLYKNDIKILEFTATPDGTIYDLNKWGNASAKILGEPGVGYLSSFDLLKAGRIKQYKDLCGYDKNSGEISDIVFDNIREIKCDIDAYCMPLYSLIRTKSGYYQEITIQNFKQIFSEDKYDYITYDGDSDIVDINKILSIKPHKHTLIFIKEMLRCAKSLIKVNLGILYERFTVKQDDSTIMQGSLGRATGYDDNHLSIIYTNIDTVDRYYQLWNSKFNDCNIKWSSKTTKFKNGLLSGSNTFIDPDNYDGFSSDSDNSKSDCMSDVVISKFKLFSDAKQYYSSIFKGDGNGPRETGRKKDSKGFYLASIRGKYDVYSCDYIYSERKWGLNPNEKNRYRLHPCYKDTENIESLEWWFIHY